MTVQAQEIHPLSVEELILDPQNPRLPEEMLGLSQAQLLSWLDSEETLDELAASMLTNGFFVHEPLVVLSSDGEPPYTVVEGNRRFATISILLQTPPAVEADLEFEFEKPPSAAQLDALRIVPCLVVATTAEVRKFLGYRHIGGLKTWSPEAKARYLEDEVDEAKGSGSKTPFKDVGRRVGSNASGVRNSYVAMRILRVARDEYGLRAEASFVLRERFGVWTRLLNSVEVRDFIGFGDPVEYDEIQANSGSLDVDSLARVLSDLKAKPGATRAVLQDSRDATKYGRVIANDVARETLYAHDDLELAHQIVDRASLASRLDMYTRSVDLVIRSIDSYEITPDVVVRAQSLANAARNLLAVAKDRLNAQED